MSVCLALAFPAEAMSMLEYRIQWQFIPVARAFLVMDERAADLQIRSTGVAKWLYPVDSHMTGLLDETGERSLHYSRRANEGRGGRYRRDIEVTYDWEAGQAVYANFGEKHPPLELRDPVLDPLSLLTWLRDRDLEPDGEIYLRWSDGREVKILQIQVSGPEWVDTPAGGYPAYRLVAAARELGGAFKETDDPELVIWVTAEKPRIPIKVESRLRVGSFGVMLHTPTAHTSRRAPDSAQPDRPRRSR